MGILDVFRKKQTPILQPEQPMETVKHVMHAITPGRTYATHIEIDSLTADLIKRTFIAFDVETTGLNTSLDRIVEVGAVVFVNGVPEHRFQTLVNPGVRICASASDVNHVTNEMLANAPQEETVYPKLIEFLGEALQGKVIMCAHNARFDFEFLCNTLSRLGHDANIKYVDTLYLSRKHIKGLENHKQSTVGNHFGFTNEEAHRAGSDAEICGKIVCGILDTINIELEEEKKQIQHLVPVQEELEVCAYIQKALALKGADVEKIRYRKNSNNYVESTCLYPFLKFKFTRKGKYIIVSNNAAAVSNLPTENCTESEGGSTYIRAYFCNPYELEPFADYFLSAYKDCYKSMMDYVCQTSYTKREAERIIKNMKHITQEEEKALLASAGNRQYEDTPLVQVEKMISREAVIINAVHNRCPLPEIRNLNNWEKGYAVGSPHYYKGEDVRKEGKIDEAIALFDKARYYGYEAPALYESYAKAFRQIKDYANEIAIIDEFLSRNTYGKEGTFSARRDKAIKLLFTQQEAKRKAQRLFSV